MVYSGIMKNSFSREPREGKKCPRCGEERKTYPGREPREWECLVCKWRWEEENN